MIFKYFQYSFKVFLVPQLLLRIQECAPATYVPCLVFIEVQFGDFELSLSNAQPVNVTFGIFLGRGEAQGTTGRSCREEETNSSC